jgi:hypothetical protein
MSPKFPTLADHRSVGDWLRLHCLLHERETVMSMWEACHRYGHDLTVPEVRALLLARCRIQPCQATVGLAAEYQKPKPTKPSA